jgi:hypothetical protein
LQNSHAVTWPKVAAEFGDCFDQRLRFLHHPLSGHERAIPAGAVEGDSGKLPLFILCWAFCTLAHGSGPQLDDVLGRLATGQPLQVVGPALQCGGLLGAIGGAVVNAGDLGLGT